MLNLSYSILSRLSLPFVFIYLLIRGVREPAYRQRLFERLGRIPESIPPGSIWFHAVSAGEAIATIPIIEDLLASQPDRLILVTTTTPSGSKEIQHRLGTRVSHCFVPYDIPLCVKGFLYRAQPKCLILIETELWPHLIRLTSKQGIPVYVVNARLSERSMQGYQRIGSLTQSMLQPVQEIACQYDDSAERFRRLGVSSDRLRVTGSIKFDVQPEVELSKHILESLNSFIQSNRNVWIAGSTHPGEENIVLDAHVQLRSSVSEAKLILAPRHVRRAAELVSLGRSKDLRTNLLTDPDESSDVLIVDVMGILFPLYQFARVAFLGGSLQNFGGHNPIEPAFFGLPLLMGSSRHNFAEVCRRFTNDDCLDSVTDSLSLARCVQHFLTSDNDWQTRSTRTLQVLQRNRGARQRVHELMLTWLTELEDDVV